MSDIIPAVFRAALLCLLLASAAFGETLDEAVHTLAKRISARLTSGDLPKVTARNLSSLSSNEVEHARTALERALLGADRAGHGVNVTLTIAPYVRGYLLVTELQRNGEPVVDMQAWRQEPPAPNAMRTAVTKHLEWEQDSPMLDLVVTGDRMLILEPSAIVAYSHGPAGWERPESRALGPVPIVRDARGRLQAAEGSFTAFLPGATCRGSWMPALDADCEPRLATFPLGGEQVRFTPGRNTMEVDGRAPFYSLAQVDEHGRTLSVVAEPDGRTRIYDSNHNAGGEVDSWGDDFAGMDGGCTAGELLATSSLDRASKDAITAFELVDRKPVQTSEPLELPGPVLALWPAEKGALAIIRSRSSGRYAAYSIGIDCGH